MTPERRNILRSLVTDIGDMDEYEFVVRLMNAHYKTLNAEAFGAFSVGDEVHFTTGKLEGTFGVIESKGRTKVKVRVGSTIYTCPPSMLAHA